MQRGISPVCAPKKLRTPEEERHGNRYFHSWLLAGTESGPGCHGSPREMDTPTPACLSSKASMEKVMPELRNWVHSFMYSFIPQIFIECQLPFRHCDWFEWRKDMHILKREKLEGEKPLADRISDDILGMIKGSYKFPIPTPKVS